jgi:hypothetical protein
MTLRAPFPWFGGKRKIASEVWARFGAVPNYIEPFAGSLAVLLQRPAPLGGTETVNDKDGLLSNYWRAVAADPDLVAQHADWPVSENDLHARHYWLVTHREILTERLEGDPEWYDARAAGWWVWGCCCWIGRDWCAGDGPWRTNEDGRLGRLGRLGTQGQGINRQLPHLGTQGQGIRDYFRVLSARLRRVRVASGDWQRVLGPSVTTRHGLTGVFLDPPYAGGDVDYATGDRSVAAAVGAWCREHGADPLLRVALCGYEGDHDLPGWGVVAWNAGQGFGGQRETRTLNGRKERIWFSPGCLGGVQRVLL